MNASAGRGGRDAAELQRQLGVPVEEVPAAALADRIRAEIDAGAAMVGVAGGDGTMRTAAGVLAGSETALLCVPTGTLNSFANRIGIPDVDAAIAALAAEHVVTEAIGAIDDDVFLNTVTFGEYARVVRLRERWRRFTGKWPAAALAFTVVLASARRVTLTLGAGDIVTTRRTPFVWIGIGWGSFPRVPHAAERRRDPELEVAILHQTGAAAAASFLLRVGARAARGVNTREDRKLHVMHTTSLTVDTAHRVDATIDGEIVRLRPPLRLGLHPHRLRVLAGPTSDSPPA